MNSVKHIYRSALKRLTIPEIAVCKKNSAVQRATNLQTTDHPRRMCKTPQEAGCNISSAVPGQADLGKCRWENLFSDIAEKSSRADKGILAGSNTWLYLTNTWRILAY